MKTVKDLTWVFIACDVSLVDLITKLLIRVHTELKFNYELFNSNILGKDFEFCFVLVGMIFMINFFKVLVDI